MGKAGPKTTERYKKITIIGAFCFCVVLFTVVILMNVKSEQDQYAILETSVENQLIATSLGAREFIDVDDFISYNSIEDTESDEADYDETLEQLRHLANEVGAEYIYALKIIDGKCYFIFDTDTEVDTRFTEYEPFSVHLEAFNGNDAAAIMNVDDEFGSFNTGAVPIYDGNEIVGVISTDISDTYISESRQATITNMVILIIALAIALGAMLIVVLILTNRLRKMQVKLERMAHYDVITGLPNRQYLMEYLGDLTDSANSEPFALFFIDLDNFKAVNDNAGHDAGDELLRHIAIYLDTALSNSKSFRPSAGKLNIAARIGGDEFIQVVAGIQTEEEAALTATSLLENFQSQKLDKYVEKYKVGLSIGVALFPYHTEDYNVLIKYADTAMYHAKHSGKNNFRIYKDEMSSEEAPQ